MDGGASVDENPIDKNEIFNKIKEIQQYILEHKTNITTTLWEAMDGISLTFLAFQDKNGEKGWAKDLKNSTGNPMWTEEQVQMLEKLLPTVVDSIKPKEQHGGAEIPFITGKSFHELVPPSSSWISLDGAFYGARDYLKKLDEDNKQIAKSLGFLTFVGEDSNEDIKIGPIPYINKTIDIPPRVVLPLINTILESIRLLVSVTFDIKILRQLFSLTLALLDFARGEWKNAILSFLGVFSRDWLLIGVVGKTGRWVYNFISPDIQENLEEDIFKSGKSMFIGVWLWLASILSPSFIRKRINSLIENINIKAKKINEEIESI